MAGCQGDIGCVVLLLIIIMLQHGAELTDHSIFAALSSRWEADFHQDMAALNVSVVAMATESVYI